MKFGPSYEDALFRATGQHLSKGLGIPLELIAAAEERLGLTFPLALREFYLVAGNIKVPPDYGDWLYSLDYVEIDYGYLHIISDYIAEPFYGICLDHIGMKNPPVYWVYPEEDEDYNDAVLSQPIQSKGRVCEFLCNKIEKWSSYHQL